MRRTSIKMVYTLCSAACILASATPVSANPSGATVVHGDAQISSPAAGILQVDSTSNSIINWQSFSIGQNETTRFNQASASNAVLNRVTGPDVSSLLGNLSSNGHVFLINSNGIVIGEHAVINTASFVASTLDISNQDFLDQRLNFAGNDAGAIVNRGFVTAGAGGEIILVAPQIENHGVLSVEDGNILLAAGEKVTISSIDLAGIEFEIQAPDNSVLNLGELIAEKGSVGVFAGNIKHEGVIAATSIGTDSTGNIVLQAQSDIDISENALISASGNTGGDITVQSKTGTTLVSGDIEAIGVEANGGDIKLLGEYVGLSDNASVDASGATGGGEILIGGDYRGENPDVQNASATFVGADVSIAADAEDSGDGGRVIVWGTDAARVYGQISARATGFGNGGFVETSGHYLDVTATPDVSSAFGDGGTWLLDPFNISIQGNPTSGPQILNGPVFTAVANDSYITAATLATALNAGNNVTIDTVGSGSDPGNVTFSDSLDLSLIANATFTVLADGDIVVYGGIVNSGANLKLDFLADRNGDGTGGFINLVSGISSGGGDILFTAPAGIAVQAGASVNSNDGHINFVTNNGNITLVDEGNVAFVQSGTGTINLIAQNGIIDIQGGSYINASDVTLAFGRSVGLGGAPGAGQVTDTNFFNIGANALTVEVSGGDISIDETPEDISINNITLRTDQNIQFVQGAGLTAINRSGGVITLQAPSGEIINNSTGDIDVVGATLNVLAAGGINIDSQVSALSFNNSGEGAVRINNNIGARFILSLLGGTNNATGYSTIIQELGGGIAIDGDFTHNASFGSFITAVENVTNNASVTGNGGGTLLGSTTGNVVNLGTITDSGGVALVASAGGVGNNGDITNAGSAENILIQANTFQSIGGTIDAGALAQTTLNRATSGNWALGSDVIGLDTIANTIAIGGAASNINNITVGSEVALTGSQDLLITASGLVDFQVSAGTGITGADLVRINAARVDNGMMSSVDIAANLLEITTTSGIGTTNALETQVSQLDITNGTGGINILNNGTDLTVIPGSIDNLGAGNIQIVNNSGDLNINGTVTATNGAIALSTTTSGDIFVNTDLSSTAGVNLNAADNIIVGGPAATDNNIVMQSTGGTLQFASGGTTTLAGGILQLDGATVFNNTFSVTGGTMNVADALTVNNVLNNVGNVVWTGDGNINGTGTINNQTGGLFTVVSETNQSISPVFNNNGRVYLTSLGSLPAGVTDFASGYSQTTGLTSLRNSATMNVTGDVNLLGGALNGDGTINASINNAGGLISPGYVDANGVNQYGVLTVNGNLTMGTDSALLLNFRGSDVYGEVASGAGFAYDSLDVNGTLALDGNLIFRLDSTYRGGIGDRSLPLTYDLITGSPATVTIRTYPSSFVLIPRLRTDGVGTVMVKTPYETATPTKDIRILTDKQEENVKELIVIDQKRYRMLQKEREKKQQEDKRRKATANCA
ncbi:MAG: filamentous hemagglutinin N-terminal domain-containing protein [Gammaproteobacteria bacterium]|nr:filamentous hemagglutinin N-terminal domain-containing protein [Gammaproteobacteria bacterium]